MGYTPSSGPLRPRHGLLWVLIGLCVASQAAHGAAAASTADAEKAPVVTTRSGAVRGRWEDGLAVFRGIPFAAPPVGDLRWRPPAPAASWQGVRPAETFAKACYQASGPYAGGVAEDQSSEDCLYLNVWTPARSFDERLPVMVWIYGGGFTSGATSIPWYSGEQLAAHGVVVVSVAYRVGAFGFLAHPALSAESADGVSGNYGLLDQLAGLAWVRDNIARFGGDPARVTIFGESAGGISVSMLAASPLAKGLFRGAISESGGSFGPTHSPPLPGENVQRLADAEQAGIALASALDADGPAELRAAPAADVQAAAGKVQGVSWPVMDGHVIAADPYRLYQDGRYNDVAVLIGFNSDEGALFIRPPVSRADFETSVRERYGPYAGEVLDAFASPESDDATQAARDLATDVMFGWHTRVWADLQVRTGRAPVYLYYFDQRPPYPDGGMLSSAKGAPHAAELAYVFGHLDQQRTIDWRPQDRAVSGMMQAYWTNFARSLDPNGPDLPKWQAYRPESRRAMVFRNGEAAPGTLPDPQRFEVLDRYFAWRRQQEAAQR